MDSYSQLLSSCGQHISIRSPNYRLDSRLRLLCNNISMLFRELVQLQVHYGQPVVHQRRQIAIYTDRAVVELILMPPVRMTE